MGEGKPSQSGLLKLGAALFPLDAEPLFQYGFSGLEDIQEPADPKKLEPCIRSFQKSLVLNPMHYWSHFNLGKAYFRLHEQGGAALEDYLPPFKRAAFIRWNNLEISLEALKMLLPLWPLLEEKDRLYSRNLLQKMATVMYHDEFATVVKYWEQYSRDLDFFQDVLDAVPRHGKTLADSLARLEIHLQQRLRLMAVYENQFLQNYLEQYRRFQSEKRLDLKNRQWLLSHIQAGISGYFRLAELTEFNEKVYLEFKKKLLLEIISLNMTDRSGEIEEKAEKEKESYLFNFIRSFSSADDQRILLNLLNELGFFSLENLRSQYFELLLFLRMGDYSQLMEKGEEIRNSLSFVREHEKPDYMEILLLIAEGYVSQRRFEKAEEVLYEAEGLEPGNEEIFWQKCKIKRIQQSGARSQKFEDRNQKPEERISNTTTNTNTENVAGDSVIGVWGSDSENKCEQVKNSRVFELKSTAVKKIVYLMDDPVLIITCGEAFKQKMKDKHLLQVFIDGRIYFEEYWGQVKEEVKVKVERGEWKKVEVEIRVN